MKAATVCGVKVQLGVTTVEARYGTETPRLFVEVPRGVVVHHRVAMAVLYTVAAAVEMALATTRLQCAVSVQDGYLDIEPVDEKDGPAFIAILNAVIAGLAK